MKRWEKVVRERWVKARAAKSKGRGGGVNSVVPSGPSISTGLLVNKCNRQTKWAALFSVVAVEATNTLKREKRRGRRKKETTQRRKRMTGHGRQWQWLLRNDGTEGSVEELIDSKQFDSIVDALPLSVRWFEKGRLHLWTAGKLPQASPSHQQNWGGGGLDLCSC